MSYRTVINFWFDEIKPAQWWVKDEQFDELIRKRFLAIHTKAVDGELFSWRDSALGRLAEIIVLDQFSRNIYRDTPQAFSADPMALALAQTAVELGLDQQLDLQQKAFLYMPFMHSESLIIHQWAESLFAQPGLESNYDFEQKHKVIIERFGRYPHRNSILDRESSEEEKAFLTQPNSSF